MLFRVTPDHLENTRTVIDLVCAAIRYVCSDEVSGGNFGHGVSTGRRPPFRKELNILLNFCMITTYEGYNKFSLYSRTTNISCNSPRPKLPTQIQPHNFFHPVPPLDQRGSTVYSETSKQGTPLEMQEQSHSGGSRIFKKFCGHAHFRPLTPRVSTTSSGQLARGQLAKLETFHELLFCLAVWFLS